MNDKELRFYETQAERFVARLAKLVVQAEVPLTAECCTTAEPVPFARRLDYAYRPIAEGEVWGRTWESGWFRLTGDVPAEWKGACVVAKLNLGSEGCVFSAEGKPVGGLSRASIFAAHFRRDVHALFDPARGRERVELHVETAANDLFGINLQPEPARDDPARHGSFEARVVEMRLALVNKEVRSLHLDAAVLFDLMRGLPERSPRRARILRALTRAANAFRDGNGSLQTARATVADALASPAEGSAPVALAVGHAHIDTGWLWPVRETIRKCARTFSSQIALIRDYPGYVFGASQPQHYAFVKKHYPALYEEVKAAVAAGSWELQGAMWVEADCNVPSGESLVRQILHGKNFFRDEFGVDVRNLWIPDVFGYSAALPQILKLSGVDSFLTQKISWNQFNRFPHHTFRWRGIDSSEVVTHFPPEDTYNSVLSPSSLRRAADNFEERGMLGEFAVLFGVGDGGGGPLPEHIESGLRQRNLEGSPRVVFGKAQDFFDRLQGMASSLPVWVGELYFELHRGTLTTQARNKRMNRVLEHELRALEFLLACAGTKGYPAAEMDEVWKRFLINQFHDILPGSSIHQVYVDSQAEYAALRSRVGGMVSEAADRVFAASADAVTLLNTLNQVYDDPVELPAGFSGSSVSAADGSALPFQYEEGRLVVLPRVGPLAAVTLVKAPASVKPAGGTARETGLPPLLENALVRYEFTAEGTLASVFDKEAGREVLAGPGLGNVLSLYNDGPLNWDAWDVDLFYEEQLLETATLRSAMGIAAGPVRSGYRFEYAVGASTVRQDVYLSARSKRLDFRTTVQWRERKKMLRVSFDVDVVASEASFDIQYGTIRRPTHRNTSWDMARFEVCGHRFADLSEDDRGVALLNDCKYGYKVHGRRLDLNLLRAPTNPDPDADQGAHELTYSLLPHAGRLAASTVIEEAAKLNQGILLLEGHAARAVAGGGFRAPCSVEGDGVVLAVLKRAEKEDCLIVRVYEAKGRRARGKLLVTDPGARISETGLMEWDETGLDARGGNVELDLSPYQIRTFKVR